MLTVLQSHHNILQHNKKHIYFTLQLSFWTSYWCKHYYYGRNYVICRCIFQAIFFPFFQFLAKWKNIPTVIKVDPFVCTCTDMCYYCIRFSEVQSIVNASVVSHEYQQGWKCGATPAGAATMSCMSAEQQCAWTTQQHSSPTPCIYNLNIILAV